MARAFVHEAIKSEIAFGVPVVRRAIAVAETACKASPPDFDALPLAIGAELLLELLEDLLLAADEACAEAASPPSVIKPIPEGAKGRPLAPRAPSMNSEYFEPGI